MYYMAFSLVCCTLLKQTMGHLAISLKTACTHTVKMADYHTLHAQLCERCVVWQHYSWVIGIEPVAVHNLLDLKSLATAFACQINA